MSTKVAVGSIPEKICYVFSDEEEVFIGCQWDVDWFDQSKNKKAKVLPTFPVEDGDDKSKARAIQWAEMSYGKEPKKAKFDIVDNKPLQGVKVFSLEHRGQGGRAYKAVIGKYYVDLREDVLMDTMLQSGVAAGGVLLGEYVWAKMQSQMKLVRVGSELHRLVTEFDSKRDVKPISKDRLEIGGVYQTRKKERAIFLGYVNTVIFSVKDGDTTSRFSDKKISFDLGHKSIRKAMLFYEVDDFILFAENAKQMKNVKNTYRFKIKKSHAYIEKIDQITTPKDIVSFIRSDAQKKIKDVILEYTGHKKVERNYSKVDSFHLRWNLISASDYLNLSEYSSPDVEPFDVKKYLLFS